MVIECCGISPKTLIWDSIFELLVQKSMIFFMGFRINARNKFCSSQKLKIFSRFVLQHKIDLTFLYNLSVYLS